MVRQTLCPSIDRIECVRRKGCGHDPFVVPFVDEPIHRGMVLEAVDEVDPGVCKQDEERVLEICPYTPWNIEWGMEGDGAGEVV